MITPDQERYILDHAYVPEHTVGLMAGVSQGEPFLLDDYLGFKGESWVILVGYPLAGDFDEEEFGRVVADAMKSFRPVRLWFIAPAIPPAVMHLCQERESDDYYTLALQPFELPAPLRRLVHRASRELTLERGRAMTEAHGKLIAEFLAREKPGPRIERLFRSMPEYVSRAETAVVLTAWDRVGEASAFYVVDLDAKYFATYVVGCHSKRQYVVGASDALFHDMIALARGHGKSYIHLGLGVNEGIRRFKEKWGGVPRLRYEFCEFRPQRPFWSHPFTAGVGPW